MKWQDHTLKLNQLLRISETKFIINSFLIVFQRISKSISFKLCANKKNNEFLKSLNLNIGHTIEKLEMNLLATIILTVNKFLYISLKKIINS